MIDWLRGGRGAKRDGMSSAVSAATRARFDALVSACQAVPGRAKLFGELGETAKTRRLVLERPTATSASCPEREGIAARDR